jgi:NodT family efflux transporter outer membrane factor (OMF) lipoprotein
MVSSGCMVGPKYQRPAAPTPPIYKKTLPENSKEMSGWKAAEPIDATIRGKWWELYRDPDLNALEEQVDVSNQSLLAAEAQYRAARDAVKIARSGLFPTATAGTSITSSQASRTTTAGVSSAVTIYDLPISISYLADTWGSIRRGITASAASAQASAAQLENARLALHSELAQLHFQLHGIDGEMQLLDDTVKSYQEYLDLTKIRFDTGVASGADVAQAQTQLSSARAQRVDLGVARTQYEHAIAILIGKPPSELSIAAAKIDAMPPSIPVGVPSDLLERRPDIAAAERQMAEANEQIGIAKAAFYPSVVLSASGGLGSSKFTEWFTWPSRLWSVGPQLAQTLFDAGKRRAQTDAAQAAYDATVANYRQTVLTGFQQVEDNLSALRVLAEEARVTEETVQAAMQTLEISTYQYKAGTVNYLPVITAQTSVLQNQISAVNILTRRMVASVLLIEALGGGWDSSALPDEKQLMSGK